ncbi:hypothetical protein ASPACDRAFT_57176 [Aspergillus aculeatus ATCC 16872]|uniref:Rhodopsin domain-containing protein n=1 Tax=Aspergillus aculeatus (strain ATCC 16872 / CBS 172.66 / WB 5094) TaxID=690307 RepID=A0A1L9X5Q4_ASPA1|nr:uncharacterized protein ASPACDRAFT_57176 [Aspergillus aculeatus ATCC 16872]OJK03796.1 hypothetical protein ASPACDRAFT_57176 [Aspergillus aculeatus ATCC 16872]
MDDTNNGSTTLTYEYRRSLRSEDILTQTVCLTVSSCCVGMRLYSKISITRAPGWEDLTCFLAWLGLIGYAAITFETDRHGSGIHQWAVAASDLREFSKVLYGPLIYITKLSILLLYLRLFAPSKRNTPFWLIQTLNWMNFLFYLADTIVKICECKPRSKIWDQDIPGQCININIRSCACICSVMRLVVSVRNRTTRDRTHDWFPEFLWTTAEITSGIVASCLPALPSFFKHSSQKAKAWVSSIGTGSASTQVKGPLAAIDQRPGPGPGPGPAMRIIPQRVWRSGHDFTSTTESTADSYWEMRDVGAYQGICYTTTEATANRSVPEAINVDDHDPTSEVEQRPRAGILKIVEVDIETGPETER